MLFRSNTIVCICFSLSCLHPHLNVLVKVFYVKACRSLDELSCQAAGFVFIIGTLLEKQEMHYFNYLRNEFHFSEVDLSVHYIGLHAK